VKDLAVVGFVTWPRRRVNERSRDESRQRRRRLIVDARDCDGTGARAYWADMKTTHGGMKIKRRVERDAELKALDKQRCAEKSELLGMGR